jgi:hypothetical protein
VIGNPPWDQVQVDPQEFFASRLPEIADAANMAARDRLIAKLADEAPALYAEYKLEQRRNDGMKHFVHASGVFPLTSYGRLNTFSLFAELGCAIISGTGLSGMILPTGIATDSFNQYFFGDLVKRAALNSIYDFENEEKIFAAVHNQFRFSLLTIAGYRKRIEEFKLAFRARRIGQLESKTFSLTPDDVLKINPNTLTCPVFESPRHAEIIKRIYRQVPVLYNEEEKAGAWDLAFQLMFMMGADSGLFQDRSSCDTVPLYEAKMIHHFDHRFATYENATQAQMNKGTLPRLSLIQHSDPTYAIQPRYWVDQAEVDLRLAKRNWDKMWYLGWRDVARSADERTMICSILPRAAVSHKLPIALTGHPVDLIVANLSSFVLDYVLRQKMAGASVTFFLVKQLPVLPPSAYGDWTGFIGPRVLELTYTAWDMAPFAHDLGDDGPPFRWDEDRRFLLRAELDAAFFHLYGIARDDVDYIMETFPIVKRKNISTHGTYRTKDKILEIYDAMTKAKPIGADYQSPLTPPSGHGPRHPAR